MSAFPPYQGKRIFCFSGERYGKDNLHSERAGNGIRGRLHHGADPAKVVVERNAVIVPREKFADVKAGQGDSIEVVQFVGGG